jgi:hypothetical protein
MLAYLLGSNQKHGVGLFSLFLIAKRSFAIKNRENNLLVYAQSAVNKLIFGFSACHDNLVAKFSPADCAIANENHISRCRFTTRRFGRTSDQEIAAQQQRSF